MQNPFKITRRLERAAFCLERCDARASELQSLQANAERQDVVSDDDGWIVVAAVASSVAAHVHAQQAVSSLSLGGMDQEHPD